ncbi:hypothetical protein A3Q56_02851 [Intoshia linei]|uniref:Methyltransferase HEMK2 n=1 Tax=Intoshia linei TaxID=1819745 RepID=A0A177B5K3_9BILA|nr:hypothetical protein A3Q56_02851 [Intoshia linei]
MKFKTPNYDFLRKSSYTSVYPPSEDTFILMDALEDEYDFLKKLKPTIAIEVFTGSGVLSTFLSKLIESCFIISTDINNMACSAAAECCRVNNINNCDVINTNLTTGLEKLQGQVDVIIANPPYVPCLEDEQTKGGIYLSWTGGNDGCSVINNFFENVSTLLSTKGVLYAVLIKDNDIEKIRTDIFQKYKLKSKIIKYRPTGEKLYVLKVESIYKV